MFRVTHETVWRALACMWEVHTPPHDNQKCPTLRLASCTYPQHSPCQQRRIDPSITGEHARKTKQSQPNRSLVKCYTFYAGIGYQAVTAAALCDRLCNQNV